MKNVKLCRRDFLRASLLGSAAGMFGLWFRPLPAHARLDSPFNFRVLVKISLLGGCDSHGMWIPNDGARFSALLARRPFARFTNDPGQNAVDIGYSQGVSLHPGLAPLLPHVPDMRVFLNTSNALSYGPWGQTGSHEDAQNIMTMGTRNFNGQFEGWTARLFDNEPNCKLLGFLGTRGADMNCDRSNARCENTPPPTVETFETFRFDGSSFWSGLGGANNSGYVADVIERLAKARPAGAHNSDVEAEFSSAMAGTFPAIADIQQTVGFQTPLHAQYSGSRLSKQLRNVAMLIKRMTQEGSSDRYVVSIGFGGMDVHDNWVNRTQNLMSDLGSAVGTFMSDVKAMGAVNNTVLMTSTEFGRTLYDNATGTDHGTSSTTLVLGGPIKGGSSAVFGQMLTPQQFATLDVPPSQLDNRGITSAILNDFMGIEHTKAFPEPIASEFSIENYDLFK